MANHNEVAHAWANKTGKHRKGYRMFYEGDAIYSHGYHFTIARHVMLPDGSPAVLFNSRRYSVSTSKHQSYVSRACSHLKRFTVPAVNVLTKDKRGHRANLAAMKAEAKAYLEAARKSRTRAGYEIGYARLAIQAANEYAKAFRLGAREITPQSLCKWADVATLEKLRFDSEQRAIEAEKKRQENWENRLEIARLRGIERDRKNRLTIRDWLNGADVFVPHTARPYARVKGDKVETSWGASVPLADAKLIWHMLKAAKARGSEWYVPVDERMCGDFQIDWIKPEGVRIGCHTIPYRYACMAAKIAGIE